MVPFKRIFILIILNIAVATTVILTAGIGNDADKDELLNYSGELSVWQSRNCIACHSIFGLGGHLGPDLTNTYGEKGAAYIDFVLTNGLQNMPKFKLSQTEKKQLILYLEHVNELGKYPLDNFSDNPFGDYYGGQ